MHRNLSRSLILVALAIGTSSAAARAQEFESKAEYDAYLAVYEEQDPATKVALGEAFLRDYPESDAARVTYQLLVATHYAERNWESLLDAAKRFDRAFPDADDETRMFIYQRAMAAGQQAAEPLDVLEFGDKVLEIEPGHLGALLTLPPVILDNIPEFGRARETNLARAFDLASRARLRAQSAYPEGGNAQRAMERAQVFSRIFLYLGQVHELRGDDERAAGEYARILSYDPQNSDAYLRIGLAFQRLAAADSDRLAAGDPGDEPADLLEENMLRNLDLAIDNLISAVALGGLASNLARAELEQLYAMRTGEDDAAADLESLIAEREESLSSTP